MYQQRRSPMSGRLIIAAIVVVISLISVFAANCWSIQSPTKKQHIDISVDQEIALGLAGLGPSNGGPIRRTRSRSEQAVLVNRVGQRIDSQSDVHKSPYKFAFHAATTARSTPLCCPAARCLSHPACSIG